MPGTVFHQLSATTPDNTLYEIRPSHWNESHGFTLSAVGSEISGAFDNGGGVTFGLETNGKITASAPAGGGGLTNINISAGTTSNNLSAFTFSNANGVSFGLDASTVTASHNGLTSQSNQNVTAANGGFAFQTLSFSNANGLSFGTSAGSAITGSYTVPAVPPQSNQTLGLYFQGNTTGQSSSSTVDARSVSFDGAGIVSLGWSNGTVRVSATQSNQAFSADGGSSVFQTLNFRNANGISFSNSDGSVQASYTVPSVPAQFSGGNSNLGNTQGDSGVVTGRLVLVGTNNITLSGSTNGGSMTISISGGAGAAGNTGSISAGTTRATLGEVVFGNSNGVSFGVNGQTVTASHNGLTSQSNQTGGIYVQGNTTQVSSSSTYDLRTLSIQAGGIISVGWGDIAPGLHISATYTRPVVSNAIQSVGSATGSGTNTSRFAADDHVHAGVFSVGVSNIGNTAGDTRVDVGRFVLAGGNNITLSQGTAAGALNTITISAANAPAQTNQTLGLYAVSNTTGQSSSSTFDARTVSFHGAGIASVGYSGGSVVISVPAGGGAGYSAGVSNLGNTAGDTGVTGTRMVFVGTNGVTLSQATDANGGTVSFSAGGGGGVTLSQWVPMNFTGSRGYTQFGNASVHICPMQVREDVIASRAHLWGSFSISTSSNSSHGGTLSLGIGIYTKNGSTLSLASSGSISHAWTNTSNSSTSVLAGLKILSVPINITLTPGQYWLGLFSRTSTVNANWFTASNGIVSVSSHAHSGFFRSSNNNTHQFELGWGHFSATSTTLPSSIDFSQLTNVSSVNRYRPVINFHNWTR